MAKAAKRGAKKVGITHHPREKEAKSQERVPPGRQAKQGTGTRSSVGGRRTEKLPAKEAGRLNPKEERTVSRRGAKGGRTGGSRAGLTSRSRKGGGA